MKRFDYDSIYSRMLATLQSNEDWANVVGNGTVDSVLQVTAEAESEIARYLEYLLGERKFTTARNLTSVAAQAEMIGYKRRLPVSAIGYVYVSHTDNNGLNRLINYNSSFFDLDQTSDFDDIIQATDASDVEKAALVPWTYKKCYTVPSGTIFTSADGIQYISTQSKAISTLSNSYSSILESTSLYESFLANGGWNGIKYLKIPVIQGIQKEAIIGISDGSSDQEFLLPYVNVEAANNSISKDYFYVTSQYQGTTTTWSEIGLIYQAESINYCFEKRVLNDGSGVSIRFGNGLTGRIPESGSIITVHYLETLGEAGKCTTLGSITSMKTPYALEDPRTGEVSSFLSCTNIGKISGGKDLESVSEIKVAAPSSYLEYYSLINEDSYKNAIQRYSPVAMLHYNVWKGFANSSDTENALSDGVLYPKTSNVSLKINITALDLDGEPFSSSDASDLVESLSSSLSNIIPMCETLNFEEPEIIKLKAYLDMKYTSSESSLTDALEETQSLAMSEYDVYNQDFMEPLYYSDIVKTIKESNVVYSDVNLALIADLDDEDYCLYTDDDDNYYLGIYFQFNTSLFESGDLMNYKNDSSYALCANLTFTEYSGLSDQSKSVFLIDNRDTTSSDSSICTVASENAKTLDQKMRICISSVTSDTSDVIYIESGCASYSTVCDFSVRNAQISYTNDLYTPSRFNENVLANELRYYIQDSSKSNAEYSSSTSDSVSSGSNTYYRLNSVYIPGLAFVDFDEDEMSGTFILPVSILNGYQNTVFDTYSSSATGVTAALVSINELLTNNVSIEISALLNKNNIEPTEKNQILYISEAIVNGEIASE